MAALAEDRVHVSIAVLHLGLPLAHLGLSFQHVGEAHARRGTALMVEPSDMT